MAEVVKGKWYPAPPPALAGEPDEAYTARLTSVLHGPYDHTRKRECALGYHRTCSCRNFAHPAQYRGACACPCHTDDATMVGEESLREVVEILGDVYSLPARTGWHVVHFVDMLTGTAGTTVERVRQLLGQEYGSEISDGFADDVVHMLANKGPTGGARAFWKRVHTEHRQGQARIAAFDWVAAGRGATAEDPDFLTWLGGQLSRAMDAFAGPPPETVELRMKEWVGGFLEKHPPTIEVVHEGRSAYSFEVPVDFLGLPDALAQTPPPALWRLRGGKAEPVYSRPGQSLLGIPVEVNPSMPPGTWKFRADDGTEHTSTWPRITVPGVETLAEAIERMNASPPAMTMPVERVMNGHWLLAQPWFVTGMGLIDHLHASCAPSMMSGLSWRVPADLLPEPHPGAPYHLYHVPVRVDPGMPSGTTPYLAFDLERTS